METKTEMPDAKLLEDIIRGQKNGWKSIGEGSQGNVFKFYMNDHTMFYAAKTALPGHERELKMESKILSHLRDKCHSNIVCFTGAVIVDQVYWLVTEFVKGKELFNAICDGERPTKEALHALINGLKVLHEAGVAHLDIKPENITYDATTGNIKYLDFGLACADALGSQCRPKGTPQYMAPEIFNVYTLAAAKKADMWSLGMTMYVWINNVLPYDEREMYKHTRRDVWQAFVNKHWKCPKKYGAPYDIDLSLLINIQASERSLDCIVPTQSCAISQVPLKRTTSQILTIQKNSSRNSSGNKKKRARKSGSP